MPKAKNIKKYINKAPSGAASGRPGRSRSRAKVEGPGVWVTCVKGKEKQTIGELYDLFESLADDLYPDERDSDPAPAAPGIQIQIRGADAKDDNDDDDDEGEVEEDLESALARELKELRKPRLGSRFANARTDIVCAVFISCRPPIDPVHLVSTHLANVERTGVTQTRHALRFTPISDSCAATLPEIIKLAERLLPPAFESPTPGTGFKYRINITSRNHSAVQRAELIPALAKCVPADGGHVVDLEHPELCIMVELYMFVCGISVVRDYDRFKKFNVVSVADASRKEHEDAPTMDTNPPPSKETE